MDAKLSDADQGEAFKAQGNTYYDLGDFPHAIEAYLNAAKHVPKDATIYNNLGAAYFSSGKNAEAIEAFKKALAVKPDDADAFFNLGIAYAASEKQSDALAAFRKPFDSNLIGPEALNAMGDTLSWPESITPRRQRLMKKLSVANPTMLPRSAIWVLRMIA